MCAGNNKKKTYRRWELVMERKHLPLHVHTGVVHRSPPTAIPHRHPADPPTTQPGK